ncbi:PLP-dependent aminotransferase family protein [Undibacterium jejuense]|uniref:PLP-dependent aminotransferase family protein n=1 Tax=Undibacterium jejuense TaxID=1344949 RepID=A0A923HGL6_9BURK|nr:PLP-dependent aminotransferase family protein [Undibacterium jejuense]MBC3862645.1 PLP-dependent aminotransferase family protein [Undibacterium jejuense]
MEVANENIAHDHDSEWPQLALVRRCQSSLVEQIVQEVTRLVQKNQLPLGSKMPSVRQFAKCNAVSTFTVVESYERLITLGLLISRRGSGYFVSKPAAHPMPVATANTSSLTTVLDALSPDLYSGVSTALPVGSGWLPPEWYGDDILLDALKQSMRIPTQRLRGYGNPLGFPSLRQHLATQLSQELFSVDAEQILLTHGATHGFDLILRTLCKPGDTVFVENPGYSNLLSLIRHHGCIPIGIRRDENGLDVEGLLEKAILHQPKIMFVNTVLQNPLGTSLSQSHAHRLLALAEQFDFWLVEDDIYRELCPRPEPSLAAMDGLRRVIRVGSFSKTLSPTLRVGSVCASPSLIGELLRVKMLAGLTTSEINERAVLHAISSRLYRRMLEKLKRQLDTSRNNTLDVLLDVGMTPLAEPRGGMFISAGWKNSNLDASHITKQALQAGIILAPNEFFSADAHTYPWFRFNIAYGNSEQLRKFLAGVHHG